MAVLKCENLSLAYEGKIVLKNVSFEIKNGDYFCIVGENGVGKSTLVKAILGLKQPFCGKITAEKCGIGYLPQMTKNQKEFPASVSEIVMSGFSAKMGLRPFYTKSEKGIALKTMQLLGIDGFKNKSCGELSGGQMQRTLLARALCAAEKTLLLDEPASGLDPLASGEMYSLAQKLNRENKITVIMVTHDINHALHHADTLLHLTEDGNHFFGPPSEYLQTNLAKRFLKEG